MGIKYMGYKAQVMIALGIMLTVQIKVVLGSAQKKDQEEFPPNCLQKHLHSCSKAPAVGLPDFRNVTIIGLHKPRTALKEATCHWYVNLKIFVKGQLCN